MKHTMEDNKGGGRQAREVGKGGRETYIKWCRGAFWPFYSLYKTALLTLQSSIYDPQTAMKTLGSNIYDPLTSILTRNLGSFCRYTNDRIKESKDPLTDI